MKDLLLFRLLFIFLIIVTITQYSSIIVRINSMIWISMLAFPHPLLLHVAHLIGSFQIITGWFWLELDCIRLYIALLIMVWVMILLKPDCLVNQIIKQKNKTYEIGFSNMHALIGIPLIIMLAYRRINPDILILKQVKEYFT